MKMFTRQCHFEYQSLNRLRNLVAQVVDHGEGAMVAQRQHRPVESVFVNVQGWFVEAKGGGRVLPHNHRPQRVAAPRRVVRLRPRVHEIFEQAERLQWQRPAKFKNTSKFFVSNSYWQKVAN